MYGGGSLLLIQKIKLSSHSAKKMFYGAFLANPRFNIYAPQGVLKANKY